MADMRYFRGVKLSKREADHSTSRSMKFSNKCSYISNSLPHHTLMACTRNVYNGILNKIWHTRRQNLVRAEDGKPQTYITKNKQNNFLKLNNSPITTGHLDTGFSRFPYVYKQMLRWFPTFEVATTCFSCSPPDLNLLVTNFIFCIHVK